MNTWKQNRNWHWMFWGIYFLTTHCFFAYELFHPFSLFITLIFTTHNAGTAYSILDWWIPAYYQKRKYFQFFLAICFTLLLFSALLYLSLVGVFEVSNISDGVYDKFNEAQFMSIFWSNVGGMTTFAIPYFVTQRVELERRNKQLEKEKLAAELNFLKSQLHPHFLFNALNNIYFLIKKDPNAAADALAGFSDLLRFQLYEAKNTHVPLDKEITYLQQFAEIAQLRKGKDFEVNWQLPKEVEHIQIPPLLLMPLLENAFKHSGSKKGEIDIAIDLKDTTMHCSIKNTKELESTKILNGFEVGGIGLTNIKKRLELLYPKRYQLDIKDKEHSFEVDLTIQFAE